MGDTLTFMTTATPPPLEEESMEATVIVLLPVDAKSLKNAERAHMRKLRREGLALGDAERSSEPIDWSFVLLWALMVVVSATVTFFFARLVVAILTATWGDVADWFGS